MPLSSQPAPQDHSPDHPVPHSVYNVPVPVLDTDSDLADSGTVAAVMSQGNSAMPRNFVTYPRRIVLLLETGDLPLLQI